MKIVNTNWLILSTFTKFALDSSSRKSKTESLLEKRSKSVDRFNDTERKKSVILSNLRKFTSFDERNRIANIQYRVHGQPLQPSREIQNFGESSSNHLGKSV